MLESRRDWDSFFPFTELVCSLSCKWKCLKWAGKVKKSTYSIHSTQIYQVSGVVEWLRLQKHSKEPALILVLTSQEGRKKRNIPGNDVWHIKTNPTQKEGRCRWDLKGGNLGEERDIPVRSHLQRPSLLLCNWSGTWQSLGTCPHISS